MTKPSPKRLHVLIIGGTRFIGFATAKRLLELGHTVTLFHRGETGSDLLPEIQHIHGNRKKLKTHRQTFAQLAPDIVVDMMLVTEADAQGLMSTFRGITRRVIAISSGDVYRAYGRMIGFETGPIEPMPLTEDSPLREKLYPYRGKLERLHDYDKIPIESWVMSDPELRGTVLRLPMVYGPHDYQHRLFPYLKRMDDKRPAILLEQPVADWRGCRAYVGHVAEAIALAVTDDRAAGRIFNVAEEPTLTEAEWVRAIGAAAGWNGKVVIVGEGKQPDHSPEEFDAHQHLEMDTIRIRYELGFQEQVDLGDALKETVAWERAHPPEQIDPKQFDYEAEDEVLKEL
jgi:nucleoside-diphosphate-sugar epimerase